MCILDLKGYWWLIYSLHYISSLYTTWVFEAYALKGICWLVPSSHYMSSQYTTWLFRTYILELNASDGWLTYTTWTPYTLHGFFLCILDLKGLWWLIYSLHYISSQYTTWDFEAYAVKGICWMVPTSHYMSSQYTTWLFWEFERIYCNQTPLMAD